LSWLEKEVAAVVVEDVEAEVKELAAALEA